MPFFSIHPSIHGEINNTAAIYACIWFSTNNKYHITAIIGVCCGHGGAWLGKWLHPEGFGANKSG